jgi:hypothetical protein
VPGNTSGAGGRHERAPDVAKPPSRAERNKNALAGLFARTLGKQARAANTILKGKQGSNEQQRQQLLLKLKSRRHRPY